MNSLSAVLWVIDQLLFMSDLVVADLISIVLLLNHVLIVVNINFFYMFFQMCLSRHWDARLGLAFVCSSL